MASCIQASAFLDRPFAQSAPKYSRLKQNLHARAGTVQQKSDAVVSDIPGNVVIVGGGPCGLTAAMTLADIGYHNIEVWDSRARPAPANNDYWGCTDRSYNVGLIDRGQAVLREMGGLWHRIEDSATPMTTRRQWSPQNPEGSTIPYQNDRTAKYPTLVLQRDRLVSCMLEHIESEYGGSIQVKHQRAVQAMTVGEGDRVSLRWGPTEPDGRPAAESASQSAVAGTDFVVAADGAGATVLGALEDQKLGNVRNVQMEELPKNTRVYKTVMLPSTADRDDSSTTYSERSAAGRVMESLPTKEGRSVGLVLFKQDDKEVLGISTEEEAAEFLQREFPNTFKMMPASEVKAFAERPPGKLPYFRYCGPELHYSNSVVLAGDAAHTVKPYFGLGVNCAIEDVAVLKRCLLKHPGSRAQALKEYSAERSWDSRVLVEESWRADQGFIYFVLPVIIDNMFNKMAPWLFERSMFNVMGRARYRLAHARWRKRLDRVMQFAVMASIAALLARLLVAAFRAAAKMLFAA